MLYVLRSRPELIVNDSEIRHTGDDPGVRRVESGDPFPGLGIAQIAQTVPYAFADIELIVEDACTALAVADDRGRGPTPVGWACDTFTVERDGDGTW